MTDIPMPALTGDSPLGVLAALGTLRLLEKFSDDPPQLRWSRGGLTAVLCSGRESIGDITRDLHNIVADIPPGAVLPGLPAGFPPPGAAPDRLRVPQHELRSGAARLTVGMSNAEVGEALQWLGSLVTDLAADSRKGGVAISQFTAPTGKQSMSTMLAKPLELVQREPDYLRQALQGWRRVAGVTGENLDHRALFDTTENGAGKDGGNRGVPGATWLALMSYPLFRTTSSPRNRAVSSGWHTVTDGRQRVDELRLPVWDQPLTSAGVIALIEHPMLAAVSPTRPADLRRHQERLQRLGIVHICRARRYLPPGGKSAGALTTVG